MMKNNKFFLLVILFLIFSINSHAEDPIAQAKQYFQMGKYDESLKICNNIKRVYPDSEWVLSASLLSAQIYQKKNQIEKAVNEYSSIIKDFKKTPQAEEAFFEIARMFMLKGNNERAIHAYDLYLNNYAHGQYKVMALFNIASICKDGKNYDKALTYYDEILKNYVSDAWFYNWSAIYSAEIYHEKKKYDKANEYYDMVIKNEDNKYLYNLATLYKGINFIDKGDYKPAEDLFQNMIKNNALFTEESLIGLAIVQYKQEEYDLSRESLSALLDDFPDTIWKSYAEEKIRIIDKKLAKIKQKE